MSSSIAARDTSAASSRKGSVRGMVRRAGLAAGVVALLAGAAWYGHDWWTTGRFIESTDDAYVGGNVTAIAPHVAGFVQRVLIEDNQRVQAGQVLVRLDPRDFQAALDHAEGGRCCAHGRAGQPAGAVSASAGGDPPAVGGRCGEGSPSSVCRAGRRSLPQPGADRGGVAPGRAEGCGAGPGGTVGGERRVGGAGGGAAATEGAGVGHCRSGGGGGAGSGRCRDGAAEPWLQPKSERRSTALSAIARHRLAPMSRRVGIWCR